MKYLFRKRRWQILARLLDGCGALLCGFPSGRRPLPKTMNSVLVVRLDHLGDMVRATAIPQLVKEAYPAAKLIFLTNTVGEQILDGNPYVDEVVVFDPKWYRIGSHAVSANGRSFGQIARYLRSQKIDVALLPRGDIRENLLAKTAKIPHRVGYGVTGGAFLLSRVVRYREDVHEDEHTLDIVRAIGVEAHALRPKVYVTQTMPHHIRPHSVGIHLEAGTSAKEWSFAQKCEFIEECATALSSRSLHFVGQDKELGRFLDGFLADRRNLPWLNLIGSTSLGELKAVIEKTSYFVGFDSGPTHLAASMGLTTLFLYSGTNQMSQWGPTAENAAVRQNKVDCSPCHLAKCNVVGHPCMSGIGRSAVVDWIKERVL
jgi:ADP-heptose:LPS heptosyltransferase